MNLKDKNVCGLCMFSNTDLKFEKFGYYKMLLENKQGN